jgi:hypothetical protein
LGKSKSDQGGFPLYGPSFSFLFFFDRTPRLEDFAHVIIQAQYDKAFSGRPSHWFVMKGRMQRRNVHCNV